MSQFIPFSNRRMGGNGPIEPRFLDTQWLPAGASVEAAACAVADAPPGRSALVFRNCRRRHRLAAVAGLNGSPGGQQEQGQRGGGPYPFGHRLGDPPQPFAHPQRFPDGGRIAAVGVCGLSSNPGHWSVRRQHRVQAQPGNWATRLDSSPGAFRQTEAVPKNGHDRRISPNACEIRLTPRHVSCSQPNGCLEQVNSLRASRVSGNVPTVTRGVR